MPLTCFAGLPPPFTSRAELDVESMFKCHDGSILETEKEMYLHDTQTFDTYFDNPELRRFISSEYWSAAVRLAGHMNDSTRVVRFLEYVRLAIRRHDYTFLKALRDISRWGVNAMFYVPTHSKPRSPRDYDLNKMYNSILVLIKHLNDVAFVPPSKDPGVPQPPFVYKQLLIQRSNFSCELTGGKYMKSRRPGDASNCRAAHIIPRRICFFTDGGSGVFTWLLLAILLTKEQFLDVWQQCAGKNGNDMQNLLLLKDEQEYYYDLGDFAFSFCNSTDPNIPLLACDYNYAHNNNHRLSMAFTWLATEETRQNDWLARRIDRNGNILQKTDGRLRPQDEPMEVHFRNYSATTLTANPSPLLLDVHNLMARLFRRHRENESALERVSFPLESSVWQPFIRHDNTTTKSNSRQRSTATTSRHPSTAQQHSRLASMVDDEQLEATECEDCQESPSSSFNWHISRFKSPIPQDILIPTWLDGLC